MTMQEVAREANVSVVTIHKYLKEHDIETRHQGGVEKCEPDPEWLRKQYHVRGLNAYEIAELLDVSHTTVLNRMKEHGIERRKRGTR